MMTYECQSDLLLISLLKYLLTLSIRPSTSRSTEPRPYRFRDVRLDIRYQTVLVSIVKEARALTARSTGLIIPTEAEFAHNAHGTWVSCVQLRVHKGCLRLDGLNLGKKPTDLTHEFVHSRVFSLIILELSVNAFSVEGVQTGEYIELFLEDRLSAEVALLVRIDSDVLVSLLSLFLSQFFCWLRMLCELLFQIQDLRVVLVETLTQMFFHVLYFGVLRE